MVAILRESSSPQRYPAIHKTVKTKKTKCKIMPKSESRILKKVVGFFSLGEWSSNGFATTTQIQCIVTQFANTLGFELMS